MKKVIIGFAVLSILIILNASFSNAAQTLIGYVNGQRVVMGIATTDRSGSLMLTTGDCTLNWDDFIESQHEYTENWQGRPDGSNPWDWTPYGSGAITDWVIASSANSYVVCDKIGAPGTSRINYAPNTALLPLGIGSTYVNWMPPHDFQVSIKAVNVPTAGRIRMGVGQQRAEASINCFQLYLYPPDASYAFANVTAFGAFMLRDTQATNLDIMNFDQCTAAMTGVSYSGFTTGANMILRLVARTPVPVQFTDANREVVTVISTTVGCYVTVEDPALANYSAPAYNYDTVIITTSSGDTESIAIGETYPTTSVLYNLNKLALPVKRQAPVANNGILESVNGDVATVTYKLNNANAYILTVPVTVSPNLTMINQSGTRTFTASGGNAPFAWTSSDPLIGTIDSTSGLFTALSLGTTTITATDSQGFTGTGTAIVVATNAPIMSEPQSVIIHRMVPFGELYE